MKPTFSLWVVLVFVAIVATGQTQPTLKFDQGIVHVVGLSPRQLDSSPIITPDQWKTILSIYTHEAYQRKLNQPIAGAYEWNGDIISFIPAYPFAPGETYHAVFATNEFLKIVGIKNEIIREKSELTFSIPAEVAPKTTIESIYPESAFLPENLLRMYIHFSSPMMPGEAYDHIALLRADGTKVEKAFLVVDQELWDSERKRFTLLFDPGRIKRDLRSNIELGAPLRDGQKYQLVIDSTWRDVNGSPLQASVSKTFNVGRAVRMKVSTRGWKVNAPTAGSLGDVLVKFDRAIDHALALKYITVENSMGIVEGMPEMVGDTIWKFAPAHPWIAGEYTIAISPLLEDVSGNNLNNPFDLDLSRERRAHSTDPVKLPLRITTKAE